MEVAEDSIRTTNAETETVENNKPVFDEIDIWFGVSFQHDGTTIHVAGDLVIEPYIQGRSLK